MSEIINTIIQQLSLQGLDSLGLAILGFKLFVKLDDNTLRLHFKNMGRATNIDIHYDKGLDIYQVKPHKLNPKTLDVTTTEYNDVYFDQFGDLFSEIFEAAR